MLKYNRNDCLPTAEELPDSDDTPVDNELQNWVPNLLAMILGFAWSDRTDWFFGVDMGIYFDPNQPAIVPDGFLSLGVERYVGINGRLSYVFWEEKDIPPILALEVVSRTYNSEYERKKATYAELGILYYVIYAPTRQRQRRKSLEVHKLVNGQYELLPNEKVWMPEIGLGLGREIGTHQGWTREWLYWYTEQGDRLPSPEEKAQQEGQRAEQERQRAEQERQRAEQEHQRAEQEHQRAEQLAAKLRELGIDPDHL